MKLDSFAGDVLVAPGGGPTISVNMLQAVSLPAEVVPESKNVTLLCSPFSGSRSETQPSGRRATGGTDSGDATKGRARAATVFRATSISDAAAFGLRTIWASWISGHRSFNSLSSPAIGSNLTFESWKGFPSGSLHASLAHANRNFHYSQAC